ncbi:MAG: hypothetical protein IPH24_17745 [Crocinitomicaceae bacterium]|nr:hypothetical protein [Crocinitomicaceae bacterium]
MGNLKKWDDIKASDDELYWRRDAVFINFLDDFYQKIKGHSNVISAEEVYKLCDKFSFFSTSIWYNKEILAKYRKEVPVIFALKSGIAFRKVEAYFLTGNKPDDIWVLISLRALNS